MSQQFFRRSEKKYLLSTDQYERVRREIERYMKPDAFFESMINNVYFDTKDDDLIIESLESPDYKYKVRVRSYGDPAKAQHVFFEIKSKLDGTVYKRRAKLTLDEYERYLRGDLEVRGQVMRELDYLFTHKALLPKIVISYMRHAYTACDEASDLRITFDSALRSRTHQLSITAPLGGEEYFDTPTYIMEVKTRMGMPLWLTHLLGVQQVYPVSFSKYGKIYQKMQYKETVYA
jgi:SPX domain protein involved in polyphosphate accumulation